MSTSRRWPSPAWRAAAGLAVAATVLLAGCSSAEDIERQRARAGSDNGIGAIARCLQDDGWDVTVDEVDRSIDFRGKPEQARDFDSAYRDCKDEFGTPEVTFEDYTPAMWRDLYRQERATAACLRDHGHRIPAVPDLATYEERLPSDQPWTSYGHVEDLDPAQLRELVRACPQPN